MIAPLEWRAPSKLATLLTVFAVFTVFKRRRRIGKRCTPWFAERFSNRGRGENGRKR